MRVLDLDLDAFSSPVLHGREPGTRPRVSETRPWDSDDVAEFLETGCGLIRGAPVPGAQVIQHDEVFGKWQREIAELRLNEPFDVVHVDGHADLGKGNSAYVQVLTQLLHTHPRERLGRVHCTGRGLNAGNYLMFALACRWISSLTYVHPPGGGRDELRCLFKDRDPSSGFVEMPCYRPEDAKVFMRGRVEPVFLEPPVPYRSIRIADYVEQEPFDYVFVAASPEYVAPEADRLLEVIAQYVAL